MKILVVCQHYYPEPLRIADICETLVEMGNQVDVITGTPNYPMGEIYSGYEKGQRREETIHGVNVHRCPVIPRKTGAFFRFLNYMSFPITSRRYVNNLDGDYDVVFVNQLSPVMMAEAGIRYKKKYHKKLVLYCLDLWPESLCAGGIKKGSLIYRIFGLVSKRIYRSADEILVTSRLFVQYLSKSFDIEESRFSYLPQYAEAQFLELEEKEQGETFDLVFAGNIGAAQSIDTIVDAAKLLASHKDIVFHIVGDGIELENLKKRAEGFENIKFYGRKPLEEMPKYYGMADAMLVTLIDDEVLSTTLPGKVQTYMAAGKAVVGAINGETALVLEESQGGYCGKAKDSRMLADNILKLKESGQAGELGRKNREYYEKMFSKERFMECLTEHLGA